MGGTVIRTAAIVGLSLFATPVASAATPGLHVDPHSPSGTEYALPLDRARDNAAPGGPSSGSPSAGQNGSGSQLFGAGVSAPKSPGKQGIKGTSGGGGTGGGSKDSGGSPGTSSGQANGLNLAAATNPDVGVQTPLLVLGASAGILFAGALLGLVFRRRRASKPSV